MSKNMILDFNKYDTGTKFYSAKRKRIMLHSKI